MSDSDKSCEDAGQMGDICWIEFPATDIKRCQEFYKTVFGWEFTVPPGMPSTDDPEYIMFSKPNTKLSGGVMRTKKEHMFVPELDAEGHGPTTNRLTMKVPEVEEALKSIKAAGGKIIVTKKEIPGGMGFFGTFRDTEGNVNGVWSKK